jgi:hypothetical protein
MLRYIRADIESRELRNLTAPAHFESTEYMPTEEEKNSSNPL